MNNRRKAKTYGKSRKPIGSLTSFRTEELSSVEDGANWSGVSQNQRGINLAPTESFTPQSHLDFSRRSRLALPKKSKTVNGIFLSAVTTPKESSEIHEAEVPLSVLEDRALFDVHSSEDENTKPKEVGFMHRKRRKLVNKAMINEDTLVYDDGSLQRHVAAEAYRDQTQYQGFRERLKFKEGSKMKLYPPISPPGYLAKIKPFDQFFSKKGGIAKAHTVKKPKETRIDQHETDCIDMKAESNREGGMMNMENKVYEHSRPTTLYRKSTRKQITPESRTRSRSPEMSNSAASTPQKNNFGGSNTSPISADLSMATSPRQLELWNMLLKDDAPQVKSSLPEAPILTTKDQYGGWVNRGFQTQMRATNAETTKIPQKRQRLIDHLKRSASRQTSTKLNLSDSFDSDSEKAFQQPCRRSPLLKSSFNIDPQRSPSQHHESSRRKRAHPLPIVPGGGLKVTYARQRSYLTDDDLGQMEVFGLPMANCVYEAKSRRRGVDIKAPRHQTNENLDESIDEVPSHQDCTMRSIHELREAGSNARLITEMEAMLDDIDEDKVLSISQKRSRLLDLTVRLQEPSFCRLFIDQGFDLRLFAHLDPGNDLLVGGLYASVALQLLTPSVSIPRLSNICSSRVLGFLIGLLDKDQDLRSAARRRDVNMSKVTQLEFENLWMSLLESVSWRAGKPPVLTIRVLCLQGLDYFLRNARQSGCMAAVLSHRIIYKISRILKLDLSSSAQQPNSMSLVNIQLAVSVLESCNLSDPDTCDENIWTEDTLASVTDLLPLLNTWSEEETGTLKTLTLRLYLNLTNNNPALCKQFTRPDVIGAILNIIVSHFQRLSEDTTHHSADLLLDNLILALGSMTNLAEWCDGARLLVLSLHYEDSSFLDTLLHLFMTKQKQAGEVFSEKETSFNVAFGYLSVLMSFLCINEAVRKRAVSRLQGQTLKPLLDAVEEFLHYHRQIDREIQLKDEEFDIRAGFIRRLQEVIDDLRATQTS